jgi:membrane associated rhomboid family serine protease
VNVWFLWIFADNVEDRMGRWRFLGFYLWCGVFATALQWYFDPELSIPVVGASGAIAGVLGAYFFLYPLERVIVLVPPLLFNIPAIAFLGVWILWQLHNATTEMIFKNGPVDVAWWAHLGGFIVGAISYRWFLRPWQRQ